MTDTLLDIMLSLICAIMISVTTYYLTNQPRQTDRFCIYLLVWYLITLLFNTIGHVITLILYPYTTLCLLLGQFFTTFTITMSNFAILRSEQNFPYKYITDILFEMPMLNALTITLYGMDRCPGNSLSLKLESYDMNDRNSLFWQILQIFMHLVVYKLICLLILLFKNNMLIFIMDEARRYLINYQEQNNKNIYITNISINKKLNNDNVNLELKIFEISSHKMNNEQRRLNIAWINLTVKVRKSCFNNEKIILKNINGFVEFGSLLALMGPSGAGKSTLLRTLMGINRNQMTTESKIYCNKSVDTKSCFIEQDVRQHIIGGLTVEQSISYATKLKNLSDNKKNFDHKDIVRTLLIDFAIEDIKDVNIGKCSSGQQKRCILAMELCALKKPTVVYVDEPTSGLDSHSALIVRSLNVSLKNILN